MTYVTDRLAFARNMGRRSRFLGGLGAPALVTSTAADGSIFVNDPYPNGAGPASAYTALGYGTSIPAPPPGVLVSNSNGANVYQIPGQIYTHPAGLTAGSYDLTPADPAQMQATLAALQVWLYPTVPYSQTAPGQAGVSSNPLASLFTPSGAAIQQGAIPTGPVTANVPWPAGATGPPPAGAAVAPSAGSSAAVGSFFSSLESGASEVPIWAWAAGAVGLWFLLRAK